MVECLLCAVCAVLKFNCCLRCVYQLIPVPLSLTAKMYGGQILSHEDHVDALCCDPDNSHMIYSGADDGLCKVPFPSQHPV